MASTIRGIPWYLKFVVNMASSDNFTSAKSSALHSGVETIVPAINLLKLEDSAGGHRIETPFALPPGGISLAFSVSFSV
jgi:hypothetical protein